MFFFLISWPFLTHAQVDRGGLPRSFGLKASLSPLKQVQVAAPDMLMIQLQDQNQDKPDKGYRAGVAVETAIAPADNSDFDLMPSGRLWRCLVHCPGATALGLNFSSIHLPKGADLFVYTPGGQHVAGAFDRGLIENEKSFAVRPLPGDELVIEYFEPSGSADPPIILVDQLTYIYRGGGFAKTLKSGNSGFCEVNINCAEGDAWQEKKNGVVKILTKVGSNFYYCTGTLLNNTAQDFSSLLLTANHCSEDGGSGVSTTSDFAKWVFYFNYEAEQCSGSSGPQDHSVVGATLLASSAGQSDIGSDFMLLKLLQPIPPRYNPYYCGWDCGNGGSTSGVCIHHPDGDVKKISTYNKAISSTTWETSPNTHWMVDWAATPNGRGVTEGGSSGAPLFDDEGLVIGTLTGGESSCQSTLGGDYFGRVAYSWKSNGSTAAKQLKPWLDPAGTGNVKMAGSFNDVNAVADFSATSTMIPVGGKTDFQDLSSGKPTSWHWFFEGATPSQSVEQNPAGIVYNTFGYYKVKLIVSNAFSTDTLMKRDFIDVRAVVSPNPVKDKAAVNLLADMNNTDDIKVVVYNLLGGKVSELTFAGGQMPSYPIQLPDQGNAFIIKIVQGNQVQSHKIFRVK